MHIKIYVTLLICWNNPGQDLIAVKDAVAIFVVVVVELVLLSQQPLSVLFFPCQPPPALTQKPKAKHKHQQQHVLHTCPLNDHLDQPSTNHAQILT